MNNWRPGPPRCPPQTPHMLNQPFGGAVKEEGQDDLDLKYKLPEHGVKQEPDVKPPMLQDAGGRMAFPDQSQGRKRGLGPPCKDEDPTVSKKSRWEEIQFDSQQQNDSDKSKVTLDSYNSDLSLKIEDSRLSASPLSGNCFPYMWHGVRATYGFTQGRVCFEVKLERNISLPEMEEQERHPHVLRVGWSLDQCSYTLGEEPLSWGYGGTGKASTNLKFKDYGCQYKAGDVVGAYLDLDLEPAVMSFTVNGNHQGIAYELRKAELKGQPIFPHILTKNIHFSVNFGDSPQPMAPILQGYTFAGKVPLAERVQGTIGPSSKADCEAIMMIGLPSSGKTTWVQKYTQENRHMKFTVLGSNDLLDKMKVDGLARKRNYAGRWDSLISMCMQGLNSLLKMAYNVPRNYIIDQTNVYQSARFRKMRGFSGFKCRAIVVCPTDQDLKSRTQKRAREEGMEIPADALYEMKANFKLPESSEVFNSVEYLELSEEEARPLVAQYNQEGMANKKPSYQNRGGRGGFRGGRGRGWDRNSSADSFGQGGGRGGAVEGFTRGGRGAFAFGRGRGGGQDSFGRGRGGGQDSFGRGRGGGQDSFGRGRGGGQDSFGRGRGGGQDSFGRGRGGGQDSFGRGRGGGQDSFGRGDGRGQDGFDQGGQGSFGRGSGRGQDNFGRGGGRGQDSFGRGGQDNFGGRGGGSQDRFSRGGGRGQDSFGRGADSDEFNSRGSQGGFNRRDFPDNSSAGDGKFGSRDRFDEPARQAGFNRGASEDLLGGNAANSFKRGGDADSYSRGRGFNDSNRGQSLRGSVSDTYGRGEGSDSYGRGRASSEAYGQGGSDSYGRGGSDSYGRGGSDSYGRGGSDSHGRGGSDSYGRGGSDSYGRGGSDSYGRGGSDSYGRGGGSDSYSRGGGSDSYSRGGGSDSYSRGGGSNSYSRGGGSNSYSRGGGSNSYSRGGGSDSYSRGGGSDSYSRGGGSDSYSRGGGSSSFGGGATSFARDGDAFGGSGDRLAAGGAGLGNENGRGSSSYGRGGYNSYSKAGEYGTSLDVNKYSKAAEYSTTAAPSGGWDSRAPPPAMGRGGGSPWSAPPPPAASEPRSWSAAAAASSPNFPPPVPQQQVWSSQPPTYGGYQ